MILIYHVTHTITPFFVDYKSCEPHNNHSNPAIIMVQNLMILIKILSFGLYTFITSLLCNKMHHHNTEKILHLSSPYFILFLISP